MAVQTQNIDTYSLLFFHFYCSIVVLQDTFIVLKQEETQNSMKIYTFEYF